MAKNKPLVTPAGLTRWTCLNKPSIKFNADGEYSVKLALPADLANPIRDGFKKAAEEARAKFIKDAKTPKDAAKIKTYSLHVPGEDEINDAGDNTGMVIFNFKTKAIVKPKDKDPFEIKVGVFDAKGTPIPANKIVGQGSKVKVAYEANEYLSDGLKQVGVSLRLKAVQVLEFVEYTGGGNAESYGFGEEDGFTFEQPEGEAQSGEGESTAPTEGQASSDF